MSVTIELEDDIDTSRGDMICRPNNQPTITQDFDAMVCWMADRPLEAGKRYFIKHTTRTGRAIIDELRYRIDVNTLHRDEAATSLGLNEMGRVHLRTSSPLMVDEYRLNRATGSFILIDETTNDTVGAGMIVDPGTGGASVADAVAEDLSETSAAA
jgi:bifunctional enzyme CysN/CysC